MAFLPYLTLPPEKVEKTRTRRTATLVDQNKHPISHMNPGLGLPSRNLSSSLQDFTRLRPEQPGRPTGSPNLRRKAAVNSAPPLNYLGYDDEDESQNLYRLNLNHLIRQRESEYISIEDFTILCGTYNVNGQSPVNGNLKSWLLASGTDAVPDLIMVSFQELDNSNQAYLFADSAREPEWCNCLQKSIRELYSSQRFAKFRVVRLVGIMLVIFIRDLHVNAIDHVDSDLVGCGLLGRLGNKGGVAVRFHLHDTSICFVASHLSAHLEESDRRNQDFREINTRLAFSKVAFLNNNEPLRVDHHDLVFWAGDLNYRLAGFSNEKCKAAVEQKLYDRLFAEHDQLNLEMRKGNVFHGYKEAKLDFRPTYKYDTGTNRWDTSEKARIPAWCDRVLWKINSDDVKDPIQILSYRSHQDVMISDHKPVSATFNVKVRKVDKDKYDAVYKQILRDFDKNENQQRPQAEPDLQEIDFGDVKFLESNTKTISIKNSGSVPLEFVFKPTPNHPHRPAPIWLNVTPSRGQVMVGRSVHIQLTTRIDPGLVSEIALTKDRCFSDVLVLHLLCGGDTFIPIHGRLALTCFGLPLSVLNSVATPFGLMDPSELSVIMGTPPAELRKPFPLPKEVFRLVDRLSSESAMKHKQLFRVQGTLHDKIAIREALDLTYPGEPIPGSIQSVGEALLDFLQALPTPLVPESLQPACMAASASTELCAAILENSFKQNSPKHHALFLYLLKFFGEFVRHRRDNFIDIPFLADLFAELSFRNTSSDPRTTATVTRETQLPQQAVNFVLRLLAKEGDITWEEISQMQSFGGESHA